MAYSDFQTRDLYERTASGETTADLVISSASDLQVKLINDGFSQPYKSSATQALPDWANWRDEAFGFTFEPAVMVYNRDLVPESEVPRSRNDLIRLIRENPARYNRRVATYDAATSGIGYLFATQDSVLFSQYWQLMVTLGAAQARLACCTGDILEMIERGEVLIAYNMLGSYAHARMLAGARIGIVLPEDYTLVMSRVAIIPAHARRAELAGRFIDYLLSQRAQEIIASQSALFAPGARHSGRGDRDRSAGCDQRPGDPDHAQPGPARVPGQVQAGELPAPVASGFPDPLITRVVTRV